MKRRQFSSNIFFLFNCKIGSENLVKFLIKKGADVNAKDTSGLSLLHWCSRTGNEFLLAFLSRNTKIILPWNGYSLNLPQFFLGNENIAKILIENGADVESKDSIGITPLDFSAMFGKFCRYHWCWQ